MPVTYEHLIGIEFDLEQRNCYTLLRQFYADNYSIDLTDYACPTDFWEKELDLYAQLASVEGFQVVHDHPRDWRVGDVLIMAIQSTRGNHCAILLPEGKILHHLYGQLSCITAFGGMFRNTLVAVYRHRDVPKPSEELIDVREHLPDHVKRLLAGKISAGG